MRLLSLFATIATFWTVALLPAFAQEDSQTPCKAEEVFNTKNAAILGVVEGLTEYIPVSSTGHLIITNSVLGLDSDEPLIIRGADCDASGAGDAIIPNSTASSSPLSRGSDVRLHQAKQTPEASEACAQANASGARYELVRNKKGEVVSIKNAADAYSIIIQFGAIIAVIFAYWRRVSGTIVGVLKRDAASWRLARNLIVAFIPAALLGFLFSSKIEQFLFNPVTVAIALIVGGILMLAVERRRRRIVAENPEIEEDKLDLQDISSKKALVIGLMQCLALWPGMSRSMSTIVGGYVAGLSPRRATEFSFLLGLITLSAASIYKGLKSYTEMLDAFGAGVSLLGLAIAFVASFISVKWLVEWISKHGLSAFAWYRFALAAVVLVWALH